MSESANVQTPTHGVLPGTGIAWRRDGNTIHLEPDAVIAPEPASEVQAALVVRPGESLVLVFDGDEDPDIVRDIVHSVQERLPAGAVAVALTGDIKMAVLRNEATG